RGCLTTKPFSRGDCLRQIAQLEHRVISIHSAQLPSWPMCMSSYYVAPKPVESDCYGPCVCNAEPNERSTYQPGRPLPRQSSLPDSNTDRPQSVLTGLPRHRPAVTPECLGQCCDFPHSFTFSSRVHCASVWGS